MVLFAIMSDTIGILAHLAALCYKQLPFKLILWL